MWKQGRHTKMWVRRFYCLVRREQIDEMVGAATNILHELCTFDSDSMHAECIGSLILEEAVSFDTGAGAGLPDHLKLALEQQRAATGGSKRKAAAAAANADIGASKGFFALLADSIPIRLTTDEWEDYTIEFVLGERRVRLRAEAKSAFDSWVSIFTAQIPRVRASPSFEGWMWRRRAENDWAQTYALLHDGVLYFFASIEAADIFKVIAPRDDDSVFIASRMADDMICLESCSVEQMSTWEGVTWVLDFKVRSESKMMRAESK